MLDVPSSNVRLKYVNRRPSPSIFSPQVGECWLNPYSQIATFRRSRDLHAMGTLCVPQMWPASPSL
jgi:hypothetical protein